MLPDKEFVKAKLEEFFCSVDEVVKPYYDKFGYRKRKLKKRGRVLFEKNIGEKLITIDYHSYAEYGINGFLVTFYSERRYFHPIKQNDKLNADDPWKYENENELKKLLNESVSKIEEQQLLQSEEVT